MTVFRISAASIASAGKSSAGGDFLVQTYGWIADFTYNRQWIRAGPA